MLTLKQMRALATAALLGLWLMSPAGRAWSENAPATPRARADQPAQSAHQQQSLQDILDYISAGWASLTRSMSDCASVVDPKAPEKSVLYLPANFPVPEAVEQMRKSCAVRVEHLQRSIDRLGQIDAGSIRPAGLLYLEHPYVVPGGRFNEMYGWDSYFIICGLLSAGKVEMAQGMVENFFFELDHYGGVLNANRTYYLTRSQPPFLTSMILGVYEAEKASGQDQRAALAWLAKAYPYAVKDYNLWMHAPHLAGDTGLSRYYDFGDGPVPEMADDPGFYRRVVSYLVAHPDAGRNYLARPDAGQPASTLIGPVFSLKVCDDQPHDENCERVERLRLSPDH